MKTPENSNYAAVVVEVKNLVELPGMDNVVGAPMLGFQAIVSKNTESGTVGILFPSEVQLSEKYCFYNNLYRHSELNIDPEQKGYLEDNRRVRAMKFRGHRSDALFMPLESLGWTGVDYSELKPGMTFDTLDGKEICRKYVVKTASGKPATNQQPKERRVDEKLFPAHMDTNNYWRCSDSIADGTPVVITAKLHGTSARYANIPVKRKLSWFERVVKRLGVKVRETEYAMVAGSRRVIKDPNDPAQNHFYKKDIWTESLQLLDGLIPEGFIVYGELIGWTDETPIQHNYTYDKTPGTYDLYVYRVAHVNDRGLSVDLSWDQVVEFCEERGLKHVPELTRLEKNDQLDDWINSFMDIRFYDRGLTNIQLSHNKTVDEGVVIRVEGLTPRVFKAKSPQFLEHETKLLDKGVEDIEASQ